jgi:myo-inositol-1(or 4)-monophosphatase
VRGRDGWAVSVALISGRRPLIGMLCAPARGEEWCAVAGEGATLNGAAITASARASMSGARIPIDRLSGSDSDLVMVAKPNSIALRIAMVACDQADLVATLRWGYEWDLAAASLIAREAGAQVSDALGATLGFNKRHPRDFGVLVSSPAMHGEVVARLAERAKALSQS